MLGTAGEPVAGLVRKQIVPAIYRGLLQDPEHIETLKPAIFQALLAQRDRSAGSRTRSARRSGGWLGRLLRHPGRRWPPRPARHRLLRAEYASVEFHRPRDDWLSDARLVRDAPVASG